MKNTKHPTYGNGKVCYIEMPAIDVNRSASFYKAVFGWQIRRRGDGHLAFDDAVNEVSGTWVAGRRAATEPGLLIDRKMRDRKIELGIIQTLLTAKQRAEHK